MGLIIIGVIFIVYMITALYIFSEKNVRRVEIWMLIYMAILTILLIMAVGNIVKGG